MIFQGLSIGMEGSIKRYLVTRLDYGSGFDKLLMDSIPVHLMLFVNRGRLPLGLAHDSCVMYLEFVVSLFGSMQRFGHGGDPQLVKVSYVSS